MVMLSRTAEGTSSAAELSMAVQPASASASCLVGGLETHAYVGVLVGHKGLQVESRAT